MIKSIGYNQGGYWEPLTQKTGGNTGFSAILQEQTSKSTTAKDYLATLKLDELAELQKASRLADPININKLSEEGARNLLAKGDKTKFVDLNNDGITEIGAGKSLIFPPPNAPQSVKDAWEKATANLSFKEKMLAQTPFLVAQLEANVHQLPDGSVRVTEPGEPGYVNPFAGDAGDFCNLIDRIVEKLRNFLKRETDPEQKKHLEFKIEILGEFRKNILL
jgi:hypothetical protein